MVLMVNALFADKVEVAVIPMVLMVNALFADKVEVAVTPMVLTALALSVVMVALVMYGIKIGVVISAPIIVISMQPGKVMTTVMVMTDPVTPVVTIAGNT